MTKKNFSQAPPRAKDTGRGVRLTRHDLAVALGVSESTVDRLIREGLEAVGKRDRAKTYDVKAARALLAAKPAASDNQERLRAAQIQRLEVRARIEQMQAEELAGRLVDAEAMRAALVEEHITVRTALLSLASKCKQRLPHLTLQDIATIDSLVREALEELGTRTSKVLPQSKEAM